MTARSVSFRGMALPVLLALLGSGPAAAAIGEIPREAAGGVLDPNGAMALAFEPWSSRLEEAEGRRLDQLAQLLRDQPDSRLTVAVPPVFDDSARHFVTARLAVIDQELHRRGMFGRKVRIPRGEAPENVVLLRVVAPIREAPAVAAAIAASAGPVDGPVAVEAQPLPPAVAGATAASPAEGAAMGAPMPLLPSASAPPDGSPPTAAPPTASPPAAQPAGTGSATVPLPDPSTAPAAGPTLPSAEPPAATAAVVAEPPPPLWTAEAGRLLREVLRDWAARAGWTVVWQSDHEYPVEASASFSGAFTEAATQLFEGFATVAPAPYAHFYKGNQVLVVQSGEGR